MCGNEPCNECKEKGCKRPLYQNRLDSSVNTPGYRDLKGKDLLLNPELKAEIEKQSVDQTFKSDLNTVPTPNPGDVPQRVSSFVAPQDKFLVWLATIMYKSLPIEIPGATLNAKYTSTRVGVWTNETTAYVSFRGTNVLGDAATIDLLDDLAIGTGSSCNITIVATGILAITQLYNDGFTDIQLGGHSLGGRAALCCGSLPGVTKVVVINAAAIFLDVQSIGPGESIATHYHIFGDLISSHLQGAKNVRVRIGNLFVNWLHPFYHSTNRFLATEPWKYSQPQEEQKDLEKFFYDSQVATFELFSLVLSNVDGPLGILAKTKICENPIPGSQQDVYCRGSEKSTVSSFIINVVMKTLNTLAFLIIEAVKTGALDNLPALLQGDILPIIEQLSNWAKSIILKLLQSILDRLQGKKKDPKEIKKGIVEVIEPRLPAIPIEPGLPAIPTKSDGIEDLNNLYTYDQVLDMFKRKKSIAHQDKKLKFAKVNFKIDTFLKPDNEKLSIVGKNV